MTAGGLGEAGGPRGAAGSWPGSPAHSPGDVAAGHLWHRCFGERTFPTDLSSLTSRAPSFVFAREGTAFSFTATLSIYDVRANQTL